MSEVREADGHSSSLVHVEMSEVSEADGHSSSLVHVEMSEVREADGHSSSLVLDMNEKLQQYYTAVQGQVPSIHRVPPNIREGDLGAYEPLILSIGPYHHGKPKLRAMEEHKWRYLHRLLARKSHVDSKALLEECIEKVRGSEARARSCYSERVDLGSDEFVKMMALDGCFILELFLARYEENNTDYPIWSLDWMKSAIWSDLHKFENQIPFFILEDLFGVAADTDLPLMGLAQEYVAMLSSLNEQSLIINLEGVKVCHLLHLYDLVLQPTTAIKATDTSITSTTHASPCSPMRSIIKKMNPFGSSSLIQLPSLDKLFPRPTDDDGRPRSKIPSVVELREAGIKLRKKLKANTPLDVTFSDGTLHIPFLSMEDRTIATFRNLIAFEQCCPNAGNHLTAYVFFLDCIIDTDKDAAILHQREIIENNLGSHKEAAQLINRILKEVVLDVDNHYLAHLFKEVNQYCESRWHQYRAMLKHTYFSNPWAIISVVAATSLLLMTVIQVIYAILSNQK